MEKIRNALQKVKCTFRTICDTIKNIRKNIRFYKELWDTQEGKKAFSKMLSQVKYLWKKARPAKLNGKVIFGTGDPAATGQILGILGSVYGVLPREVSIIPDFENERCEGILQIKGKVRLIHVLLIMIRLVSDRNCRSVVKKIMDKEKDENE